MFFHHTEHGEVTPNISFSVVEPKDGTVISRIMGVQSAKITFDMENPSTLELEAFWDKNLTFLSQCDGAHLIKADYLDFEWYFTPRTFEMTVDKQTTTVVKFSAVDALAAFRSQIAYEGNGPTFISRSFQETFRLQHLILNSYLAQKEFVRLGSNDMSEKQAWFETREMQWGELMDIYTEQLGYRFVVETKATTLGNLTNWLYFFEPGRYAALKSDVLADYVPTWIFERGDFSEYSTKTSAAEAQVLMMYSDRKLGRVAEMAYLVDPAKSLMSVRETMMHMQMEGRGKIDVNSPDTPEGGFFRKNARPRTDITVVLSEDVKMKMRNTVFGTRQSAQEYRKRGFWRPGMLVDIVIGSVTQRQEIVRTEIVMEGGRLHTDVVLSTPGTGSRDFYKRLGDLTATVQRMAQRRN